MELLLDLVATSVAIVGAFIAVAWLSRRAKRQWLEQFAWLRERIEQPDETYDLDEVMEEANNRV